MHKPISLSSINRADRIRIQYGDVASLAESLYTNGFIHPICVDPNTLQLIAGGRRCAALDYIANLTSEQLKDWGPPHPSMAEFRTFRELHYGIHYTYKTTDSQKEVAFLELIENIQRHQLSWQEEMISIAKIHSLKGREAILARDEDWTQAKTGALLGMPQASISYALNFAKQLSDPSHPFWSCSTPTEALQMVAKEKHDEASKRLAELVRARAETLPTVIGAPSTTTPTSFVQTFNPALFSPGGIASIDFGAEFGTPLPAQPIPNPTLSESDKVQVEEAYRVVTKLVHNIKFEDFCAQAPEGCVDHILCDPPYAIDMKMLSQQNQGMENIDRIADTHNVSSNMTDFPIWLAGCYKILKDKGFCIWFCDQMQWQYLYDCAIKIGFKVQRWPFVWCKTSVCINQRAEYNFTKTTEIAMIMRKGDARLVSAQASNYWLGQLTPEDKAAGVNHPFIKPFALWQYLLKAIALPGSTICDGFSGVGSSTRAMMLEGYTPLACEVDENHYAQQLQNLARVYCEQKGIEFK